jgi:hypothetical protein
MSNFVIEKNTINNICVTVSERSQLVDPYFLIVFTNKFDLDGQTVVCSTQNGVASNLRYDLLVISEIANPEPLDGEVYLIEGEWSYSVYESTLQTLLIEETTGRILQKGFCIVTPQIGN